MATVYVESDAYLDEVTYVEDDDIHARNGAVLTIRKSPTVRPGKINSSVGGVVRVDSFAIGAVLPIVIEFMADGGHGFQIYNESKLIIRGGWHILGTGDGTAGQTFTFYDSRGNMPWVQVETGNGTDEWIDCKSIALEALTSFAGPGPVLGSFFRYDQTTQTITFGDGTNGIVVPTGARVRCPDIFLTDSGVDRTSGRTEISTVYIGNIDLDTVLLSERMFLEVQRSISPKIKRLGAFTSTITESLGATIDTLILAPSSISTTALNTFSYCKTMSVTNMHMTTKQEDCVRMYQVYESTFNDCSFFLLNRDSSGDTPLEMNSCEGITINGINLVGGTGYFNDTSNLTINDVRHSDTVTGIQTTANSSEVLDFSSCSAVVVDGVTKIAGGCSCYNDMFSFSGANIMLLNVDYDGEGHADDLFRGTGCRNLTIARCTIGTIRGGIVANTIAANDHKIFDIIGTSIGSSNFYGQNGKAQGVACSAVGGSWSGSFDNPWNLQYYPAATITEGRINLPCAAEVSGTTMTLLGGARHDNIRTTYAPLTGDGLMIEIPDQIYGVSSFKDSPLGVSGTYSAYNLCEYAIKFPGGDWSAWKEATGANLSAEPVSASEGFWLKIRITGDRDQWNRDCQGMWLDVNVDPTAKRPFLYVDIALEDIVVGSAYRIEKISDGSLIAAGIATATTQVISVPYVGDTPVLIKVRKASEAPKYYPFSTGGTIRSAGLNVYVAQVGDPIVS